MESQGLRSMLRLIFGVCLVATLAWQPVWASHVNFVIGDRNLDDDFEPLDGQEAAGISMFVEKEGWPFSIVLGLYRSDSDRESGTKFDSLFGGGANSVVSEFTEVSVGVAKIWNDVPRTYPFIGIGVTVLEATLDGKVPGFNVFEDERVVGPYLNGGIFWRVGPVLNLGLELRAVQATEVKLLGETFRTDYVQFGWIAGWGW